MNAHNQKLVISCFKECFVGRLRKPGDNVQVLISGFRGLSAFRSP